MQALRLATAFSFVPDLCEHVRAQYADGAAKLAPESIEDFVKRSVKAGTAYDIFSQRDLARFVDMAMVRGLPLPASLHEILRSDQPAAPKDRLARAWRRLLFELEAES